MTEVLLARLVGRGRIFSELRSLEVADIKSKKVALKKKVLKKSTIHYSVRYGKD